MCPIRVPEQHQPITQSDLAVAKLAAGQWGILSRAELIACGLTAEAIRVRLQRGSLHLLHRGVYAVGYRNVTTEGRFLAAVKACGTEAVLSHYCAACLHCLLKYDGRHVEVTAPVLRTRPTIRTHRSKNIERVIVQGIPVTPKLRTVIDLAATEPEAIVKRALRQAKFSAAELVQLPQSILALGTANTWSPLEDVVLDLILKAGFEPPLVNQPYRLPNRTVYPDLYWPSARLVVEIDSTEWHNDPLAQNGDRERQAALEAAGERVIRITSAQAKHDPRATLARLDAAGTPRRTVLQLPVAARGGGPTGPAATRAARAGGARSRSTAH